MICYIIACGSCSFVCKLYIYIIYLIIIIIQTYLKALNFKNACPLYAVERVSKISQFSQLSFFQYMGLCVFSFSCDDRENVHFIFLSSSHRKYEPLTIVQVRSWKTMVRAIGLTMFLFERNLLLEQQFLTHLNKRISNHKKEINKMS